MKIDKYDILLICSYLFLSIITIDHLYNCKQMFKSKVYQRPLKTENERIRLKDYQYKELLCYGGLVKVLEIVKENKPPSYNQKEIVLPDNYESLFFNQAANIRDINGNLIKGEFKVRDKIKYKNIISFNLWREGQEITIFNVSKEQYQEYYHHGGIIRTSRRTTRENK